MKRILEIISQTPLFNELDEVNLDRVRTICVDQFYERGKMIFFEGDIAKGFYIVASGKVKIYKVSKEGKEKILHIFGPGNPFGEVPVFSGTQFPAHAQTLIKSHLLFIPKESFIDLIAKHPLFSLNMLGVLSRRLREFTFQIEALALKEVPSRLASYLLYLSEEQKNRGVIALPISKGQLASLLGTIPETLSRIFSKMAANKLITVKGKTIYLQNPEGLSALSENGKEI